VLQPVGIVFKGSGWYLTDSRKSESAGVGLNDTNGKTESAAPVASTDTNNTSNTSGESKPAESAASKATSEKSSSTT
jgi:hypothetical protein